MTVATVASYPGHGLTRWHRLVSSAGSFLHRKRPSQVVDYLWHAYLCLVSSTEYTKASSAILRLSCPSHPVVPGHSEIQQTDERQGWEQLFWGPAHSFKGAVAYRALLLSRKSVAFVMRAPKQSSVHRGSVPRHSSSPVTLVPTSGTSQEYIYSCSSLDTMAS